MPLALRSRALTFVPFDPNRSDPGIENVVRGLWAHAASIPPAADDEALARQFLLCYRPIVDTASGALLAVDALVRRSHPPDGLFAIPPDASTPRAALDAWAIAEARADGDRLHDASVAVAVQVNLASLAIEPLRLGPNSVPIALAFSERLALRDPSATTAFCEAARALRFDVGLAGLGASAVRLDTLARLPLDFVTLDPVLLEDAALRAVVSFGRSLGWRLIATGIVNARQLHAARQAGVELALGRYVGTPMIVADLIAWAHARGLAAAIPP
jgi:EAL domain-containing protein (putative c-di-GMP-specific phosphodiesterase class I)